MVEELTIIEEWERVKVPTVPELEEVKLKLRESALLVLDIQNQNCNEDRRPRCVRTLHHIQMLIEKARNSGMLIIFSLTSAASKADIRREVLPKRNEIIVKAGVDKFHNTKLEDMLRENGIKSVIIVGTSANGAVLHTATGAATRKFGIIVPVNAISATYPYEEQYTVWHLMNSPGTRRRVILSKAEMINFV
ncbi:MAG: isochorismatase family protein [Asgard group archaeon]|nr:isochorismatase family protein [Asgard group archaeon]